MKLEGTYTFDAPHEVVWNALMDPEVLARVMPGCEKLEQIGEDEYESILKIKVGPVQGKFKGTVILTEINEPHSYHLQVKGRGAPGHVTGEGEVRLEPQNQETILHYSGEAKVGGRIASVGQRLIMSSAKSLTKQSLEGLEAQIEARMAGPEEEAEEKPTETSAAQAQQPKPETAKHAPPPPEPPSQTDFALDMAKNMFDDLLPPQKRVNILAGALILVLLMWWIDRRYPRLHCHEEQ